MGTDESGKKELLVIDDGFPESEQSWHEFLGRLRDENGLIVEPELATGDGGDFNEAHEIVEKLVVACCDASELFELVE